MVRLEKISLTNNKAKYKYFVENGSEFGIIEFDMDAMKFNLIKKNEDDFTGEYKIMALRSLWNMYKNNKFKDHSVLTFY